MVSEIICKKLFCKLITMGKIRSIGFWEKMSLASRIRGAKRRSVGGSGKKRCRRGKSCGSTCISGGKVCLIDLPDYAVRAMSKAALKLGKLKRLSAAKKKAEKITMELKVQAPSSPTGSRQSDWSLPETAASPPSPPKKGWHVHASHAILNLLIGGWLWKTMNAMSH